MVKCCVEGCEDVSSKDITYFNFPASKALRKKWVAAMGASFKPRAQSCVCSRHFLAEDCESARGRKRLRSQAVPSVFDNQTKKRKLVESNSSESTPLKDNHKSSEEDEGSTNNHDNRPDEEANHNAAEDRDKKEKTTEKQHKRKSLRKKSKRLRGKVQDSDKNLDSEDDLQENDKLEELGDNSQGKGESLEESAVNLQEKQNLKEDNAAKKDGKERVQDNNEEKEKCGKEKASKSEEGGDSQDKCKESTPAPPDGPRDIDKQPEDIEEILTNYHILQDRPLNIHTVTEEPTREPPVDQQPVFIEISVDKDNTEATGDCLMVMESVEVELDPSELMLQHEDEQGDDVDMETVDVEDNSQGKPDPISLLTSSDEDDVIIEEPHIDTVEVSDETDEDDMPLVKLLKRRRAEKKKLPPVPSQPVNGEADIAKILWGMYEYYCVQCHFTTSNGNEYRRHTASHTKVLMMCQICGYMTASESQFTKHEKQHGEKKYKCHLCTYKAKHNMSLLYHLKNHKAEDFIKKASQSFTPVKVRSKGYECNMCSYTTKKKCDLKRHMTRRHKTDYDDDEDFVP